MKQMWIIVIGFLFFAIRGAHSGPFEDALPAELRPAEEQPPVIGFQHSKPNDTPEKVVYTVSRNLDSYMVAFSPIDREHECEGACEVLGPELKKLTGSQHWIDVGAGKAIAAMEYIENKPVRHDEGWKYYSGSDHPARVTAITVERLETPELRGVLSHYGPGRFRYLSGKYIEDYSVSELGQADLITDVYGAVAYSPHIDAVFAKFGELLKKGGKVYTLVRKIEDHYEYFTVDPNVFIIVGSNNEKIPVEKWLRAIKGFTLLPHSKGAETIILQKISDQVVVPPLELIEHKDGYPPMRKYRWNRSQ